MNAAMIPCGDAVGRAALAAEGQDAADDKFNEANAGASAACDDAANFAEVGEGNDDREATGGVGPSTCDAARRRAGLMRARSAAADSAASASADLASVSVSEEGNASTVSNRERMVERELKIPR